MSRAFTEVIELESPAVATAHVYHWRHGWIPLTLPAALAKAKGNLALAQRYLADAPAGGIHNRRDVEQAARALPDISDHRDRAAAAAQVKEAAQRHPVEEPAPTPKKLRALSDNDIIERMAAATTAGELDDLVGEIDRRDAAQKRREAAATRRTAADARKDAAYNAAIDAGGDPETAYADVYGRSATAQRRDAALSSLRANGYQGRNFDALSRDAFRDHVEQQYMHAETETRGYLFKKGKGAGRDPRQLFTGPAKYARANASEELLNYWNDHGRATLGDFQSSLLHGRVITAKGTTWR